MRYAHQVINRQYRLVLFVQRKQHSRCDVLVGPNCPPIPVDNRSRIRIVTPMNLVCPNCTTRYRLVAQIPVSGQRVRCKRCAHVWRPSAATSRPASLPQQSPGPARAVSTSPGGDVETAARDPEVSRRGTVARDLGNAEAGGTRDDPHSFPDLIAEKAGSPADQPSPAVGPASGPAADENTRTSRLEDASPPPYSSLRERFARRFLLGTTITVLAAVTGFVLQVYVMTPARMVRTIPASASLYRALGVVISPQGLTIGRLSVTPMNANGGRGLLITADIENAGVQDVPVPHVIVTLTAPDGRPVSKVEARTDSTILAAGGRTRLSAILQAPGNRHPLSVTARFSKTRQTR